MAGARHRHLISMIFLKRFVGGALLSALLLFLAACSQDEARLEIETKSGEVLTFQIEIADNDAERAQGLMFRSELADDAGMLFDFGSEREVSFWMRNTLIPLDMIFVRRNGEIARIHENAIPQDPTPIPSGEPVQFVFEIIGGRASELGLSAGDIVRHPRVVSDK